MSIFTITSAELENANRWLFETVTDSLDVVAQLLTENTVAVPCVPRYAAGFLVPYSFAGNIRLLFEYARGRKKLSRSLVEKMTIDFYRLMNYSPMSLVHEREAEEDDDGDDTEDDITNSSIGSAIEFVCSLMPRTIAVIFLGANARAQIEGGCWICGEMLEALTGVSPDRASDRAIVSRIAENHSIEYDPASILILLKTLETSSFH